MVSFEGNRGQLEVEMGREMISFDCSVKFNKIPPYDCTIKLPLILVRGLSFYLRLLSSHARTHSLIGELYDRPGKRIHGD